MKANSALRFSSDFGDFLIQFPARRADPLIEFLEKILRQGFFVGKGIPNDVQEDVRPCSQLLEADAARDKNGVRQLYKGNAGENCLGSSQVSRESEMLGARPSASLRVIAGLINRRSQVCRPETDRAHGSLNAIAVNCSFSFNGRIERSATDQPRRQYRSERAEKLSPPNRCRVLDEGDHIPVWFSEPAQVASEEGGNTEDADLKFHWAAFWHATSKLNANGAAIAGSVR